jgi:hypothetical protein
MLLFEKRFQEGKRHTDTCPKQSILLCPECWQAHLYAQVAAEIEQEQRNKQVSQAVSHLE